MLAYRPEDRITPSDALKEAFMLVPTTSGSDVTTSSQAPTQTADTNSSAVGAQNPTVKVEDEKSKPSEIEKSDDQDNHASIPQSKTKSTRYISFFFFHRKS